MDEPIPGDRNELFERVTARGRWLRQRHQIAWTAAGVCAVLAVAIPATTLVNADRRESTEVASVAPPGSQFEPVFDALPEGTAVQAPPPGPLPFPGPTLAPAPTPTTVRRPSSSPTPAPAPTPSNPTPDPTSLASPPPSPTPPPPPRCTAADVELTVASDKPSYTPAEPVKLTLYVSNRSDHVCTYDASYQMVPYNASGQRAALSAIKHVDYPFGDYTPLAPGEVDVDNSEWGHYDCPGDMSTCRPEPPGVYRVVFDMGMLGTGEVTVTLT